MNGSRIFSGAGRIGGHSRPAAPLYVIRTMDGEEIQLYQEVLLVELKFPDVCLQARSGRLASSWSSEGFHLPRFVTMTMPFRKSLSSLLQVPGAGSLGHQPIQH